VWAWQQNHTEPFPGVESYPNEDALISDVKKALDEGSKKAGRLPRVIVIGALGRCGSGAVSALQKAGLPEENILKWDMAETAKGGPFSASAPKSLTDDLCQADMSGVQRRSPTATSLSTAST
jgi:saccharopine dehydrogenase (NAD+, L-lysine-forming)